MSLATCVISRSRHHAESLWIMRCCISIHHVAPLAHKQVQSGSLCFTGVLAVAAFLRS